MMIIIIIIILTVIPMVVGALGTIPKGLVKQLEDFKRGRRVETILTTASLGLARILRRSLRLEETCFSSNLSEQPSAKA